MKSILLLSGALLASPTSFAASLDCVVTRGNQPGTTVSAETTDGEVQIDLGSTKGFSQVLAYSIGDKAVIVANEGDLKISSSSLPTPNLKFEKAGKSIEFFHNGNPQGSTHLGEAFGYEVSVSSLGEQSVLIATKGSILLSSGYTVEANLRIEQDGESADHVCSLRAPL